MYGPHPAGRPPAQWFLLLDDDILVEAHYLARLLSHKQDIVVGICTVRRDPPVPTIRYWRDDKQAFVEPIEWDWNSEKLIEVDAAGAACMLVRRCVLEKMAEAYLDCWLERQEDQRRLKSDQARLESETYWLQKAALRRRRFEAAQAENDWQKQDCWWFQMLSNVTDAQVGELGEDLSFCWKAKRLGFRIYADPQVLPGHLGEYSYSVRDWRAFVEQQVAAGFAPPQQANAPELAAV